MNFVPTVYAVLSLICFYTVFIYPQGAVILLFLSPLVLFAYFENVSRTPKTDVVSLAVLLISSFLSITQTVYFVLMVLLPVLILKISRDKAPFKSYIAPIAGAVPFFAVLSFALLFIPSARQSINGSMLEFLTALTAPLEGSADILASTGFLSFLVADKAKAAEYLTFLLPCIAFCVISIFVFVIDRLRPIISKDGVVVLRDFRLPDNFVWFFIGSGFFIIADNIYVKLFAVNAVVIFGILYFFQGVQMVSVLFDKFRIGGLFRGFIYIFLFTEPPVMALVALLGLFSIWYRPAWSLRPDNEDIK